MRARAVAKGRSCRVGMRAVTKGRVMKGEGEGGGEGEGRGGWG